MSGTSNGIKVSRKLFKTNDLNCFLQYIIMMKVIKRETSQYTPVVRIDVTLVYMSMVTVVIYKHHSIAAVTRLVARAGASVLSLISMVFYAVVAFVPARTEITDVALITGIDNDTKMSMNKIIRISGNCTHFLH